MKVDLFSYERPRELKELIDSLGGGRPGVVGRFFGRLISCECGFGGVLLQLLKFEVFFYFYVGGSKMQ